MCRDVLEIHLAGATFILPGPVEICVVEDHVKFHDLPPLPCGHVSVGCGLAFYLPVGSGISIIAANNVIGWRIGNSQWKNDGMNHTQPYWQWRPHPWHGLSTGPNPPHLVNAYIEITPFDVMKYEIDKSTGYLRMDRPQTSSSLPPTLYGFIPRTYCADRVAGLSERAGQGDCDPLDICVITERPITRAEVLVSAKVIGVLKTLDGGRADDKILAVLDNDPVWGDVQDVSQMPEAVTFRLRHYFGTYKLIPGQSNRVEVLSLHGSPEAVAVVSAAIADYEEAYGGCRPEPGKE